MSIGASIEILRAYLKSENLVICKSADTQFPIDGLTETLLLHEIVTVMQDAEWDDVTSEIPCEIVDQLRDASR